MTDYTRTQVRQDGILKPWPWVGWSSTADSLANGPYITDLAAFAHERYGPNEFMDRYVHRYNRTDTDRVRRALDLDTVNGRLDVDGGNWSNTADTAYEVLGVHPDEANDAIMRGQKKQVDRDFRPAGVYPDSDMETAGVEYYDGTLGSSAVSNAGVTKDTDSADVFSGTQSLFINLTGAGGYCRFQRYRVQPNKKVWLAIIGKTTGTMTVKVWDYSNSAYIGTTRSYSGADFALIERSFTTPAGCEEIQIEVGGTDATDDVWVDSTFGPIVQGRRRFRLPTEFAESYQVRYVRESRFLSKLADGVYDAYSRQWVGDWEAPADFTTENFHNAANPYFVNFSEEVDDAELMAPLWLVVERPLSDVEPLDSETATTSAPFEQVAAYARHELALLIRDRNPGVQRWVDLVDETRVIASFERIARPSSAKVKKQTHRRLRA